MTAAGYDPIFLTAIIPEIGLFLLAVFILILDLTWQNSADRRLMGWVTAVGLAVIALAAVAFSRPAAEPVLIWGGMLRLDGLGYVFRIIFLLGASITCLFAADSEVIGEHGEFYILLLTSTLGMSLMASAADLIMLFLAIETTSIPLYVLAGFLIKDTRSTESGFKYLLFGATTSAILAYGFSLLYGFTGTTSLYQLAAQIQASQIPLVTLLAIALLILAGLSFKASLFPFHFWAPDVYEGAPPAVAGFLSTASKAAGFAVLMRLLLAVFPSGALNWGLVLAVISTLTMIVGNVLALTQRNIKRLLAYSSIAHAGYMLVGIASGTPLGFTSTSFYLGAYLFTNLAAFGVVTILHRQTGSDEITCFAGLSRRSPAMALVLLVAFLSLGGIPPFGGFVGKVLVFASAIEAGLVWLAVLGIINSVIGLYYYLTVLKVAYLERSPEENLPIPLTRPWVAALTGCVIGILLLGTVFGPWFDLTGVAAQALF